MIVKNEKTIIERCLNSVKKIIDYWVIVDTGSSDGTQQTIKECMRQIPGELYEQPWINFAENRNRALSLAHRKGDYLFFIDADEYLEFSDNFILPELDKDAYYFATRLPHNIQFYRMLLVNNHLKWVWEGVLHETLYSTQAGRSCAIMHNVINVAESNDGHRNRDVQKYHKDAILLEKELQKEPNNSRYVFFLAQSYFQAREYDLALKNYNKRSTMGGFDEEIYFSFYMAGRLQEILNMPPDHYIDSYKKAMAIRPLRAEPYYRIADYYYSIEKYDIAFDLLEKAHSFPIPPDSLNIEKNIYDFGLAMLFIECANRLKRYQQAQAVFSKLSADQQSWFIKNFGEPEKPSPPQRST